MQAGARLVARVAGTARAAGVAHAHGEDCSNSLPKPLSSAVKVGPNFYTGQAGLALAGGDGGKDTVGEVREVGEGWEVGDSCCSPPLTMCFHQLPSPRLT